MKLNKKVKKIGLISSGILVITIIIGKKYDIPVLSTGINYILYPFEKSIHFISEKAQNTVAHFQSVNELLKENEALAKEVEGLRYDNTILNQYQEENKNLRTLLEMKNRYKAYEGTGANVIAKEIGNWYKIFKIDKGTRSNVVDDSIILANGGLVGHVDEATDTESKVISIIDSRSAVSAKVVRTGDVGMIKGDIKLSNEGLCMLEINSESEVVKGDQIITSHLMSSIYPPGILIGTVEEVTAGNNDLVHYAHVRPVVDFKHLEQVLVINKN